jgi:hypothetical protein
VTCVEACLKQCPDNGKASESGLKEGAGSAHGPLNQLERLALSNKYFSSHMQNASAPHIHALSIPSMITEILGL